MQSINKKKNFEEGLQLCLILMTIAILWLMLYVLFAYRYSDCIEGLNLRLPFFNVKDFWNDFFNPILYAWNRNYYDAKWGNCPPFLAIIAYILSFPIKLGVSKYIVYITFYFVIMVIGSVCMNEILKDYIDNYKCRIWAILVVLLSFPFLYCFDRGNFVFVVAILIICFIWAYKKEHYTLAAVIIGMAASLKLYPALLGTIFLVDKKWKEAIICALTGIGITVISFCIFKGGFMYNLTTCLEKMNSYATIGNGSIKWLIDDRNSFYQLILIPKILSSNLILSIDEVPEFTKYFKVLLTVFMIDVVVNCFFGLKKHDILLVLTTFVLGYPIESAVYNLTIVVFPILYWCANEKNNKIIPVLGTLLVTMKSFVAFTDLEITPQAVLNPIIELLMIFYIIFYRKRKKLLNN